MAGFSSSAHWSGNRLRKTPDITAFGINAYTGANASHEVVVEHHGATARPRGRRRPLHATFTVDGKEVDAPAGTLVYLDDVTARRHAVAMEPGTTVLAIGGFDLVVSS
jgi:hypothetical protein